MQLAITSVIGPGKTRFLANTKSIKAFYYEVREQFGLSAQMTVRAIAKVADAYKLDRGTKRKFSKHGSVAYDARILAYKLESREVSILSLDGRQKIPFQAGERQLELLKNQSGESDLIYRKGYFYLHATCDIHEPGSFTPEGVIGIDLGIVNIATTSDGELMSGTKINSLRSRRQRQRKRLQSKQTRSAKRVLRRLSGREGRFARDVNHTISKQIVKQAKDTGRAIALENLKGIRGRARLRKPQRIKLHRWGFHQLGLFIKYKAALAGVTVVEVDPKYTSQTCCQCGYMDKCNRKSQEFFSCVECGYAAHADINAATNIADRGWPVVNPAYESVPLSGV